MSKYRFKTEEEFLEEFGENWSDIHPGWNYRMNSLFGKDYVDHSIPSGDKSVFYHVEEGGWNIRHHMIKLKSECENSLVLFPKTKSKKQNLMVIDTPSVYLLSSVVKHNKF